MLMIEIMLFVAIMIMMMRHYNDVIMSKIASQITSVSTVYSTVFFGHRSKKTSKLRATGLCAGNSPLTGEFPARKASNAENASIWLRHHGLWPLVESGEMISSRPVKKVIGHVKKNCFISNVSYRSSVSNGVIWHFVIISFSSQSQVWC